MDGPLGPRWRKSNMILFKSCNTDLFLHYCVSRGLIHIANRYIGDSALPTRSKTDIIILFCGRNISRGRTFYGEEHYAGGKFREIPFAGDIYFAGGKFRAKSKFANITNISSKRKILVIQYVVISR